MGKYQIGVIGLGAMGLGMATRLAGQGFAVKGFDLSQERMHAAATLGIGQWRDAREALTQADIVILSLPTAQIVTRTIEDAGDALSERTSRLVILDTTTSEATVSRALSKKLSDIGHGFLDAPVSGGAAGAADGTLTMMLGGDESDYATVLPVIQTMTSQLFHVGPSGAGNVAKLANNLLAAAHMVTTSEALKLVLAAGINPEAALRVINASSGRSMISEVHFPRWVVSNRFDSGFTMALMRKDVRLALQLLHEHGLSLPLSDRIAELWAQSPLPDDADFTRMGAFSNIGTRS